MADHPGVPFVQASGYSSGRPDGPPLWIVVHDMEAGESSDRAENTAEYFATGAGGRDVSSHYCVDNDSVIQCVSLSDVAWTVGNRPGNNRGINWELAGFASQGRGEWLDDFGRAMFAQMAPIVRTDAERFGIPLERRTVAELQAFVPGVTSHNDLGLAFGGTDHTDPGPNFPWDEFLQIMNGDDMGVYERNSAWLLQNGVLDLQDPATIPVDDTEGSDVQGQVPNKLAAKLNEILAAAKAAGTPTQEQVTAAVKAALLDPAVVQVLNDAAFAGSQRAERE